MFPASKRNTSNKLRLQSGYCEYKRKALLMKVGFCDALVWSLNTNEVREVAARDENGVETFHFSGGKVETERKYENGNGNLQNGSGNGIFYAETETKTERCFSVELAWKWN